MKGVHAYHNCCNGFSPSFVVGLFLLCANFRHFEFNAALGLSPIPIEILSWLENRSTVPASIT